MEISALQTWDNHIYLTYIYVIYILWYGNVLHLQKRGICIALLIYG